MKESVREIKDVLQSMTEALKLFEEAQSKTDRMLDIVYTKLGFPKRRPSTSVSEGDEEESDSLVDIQEVQMVELAIPWAEEEEDTFLEEEQNGSE